MRGAECAIRRASSDSGKKKKRKKKRHLIFFLPGQQVKLTPRLTPPFFHAPGEKPTGAVHFGPGTPTAQRRTAAARRLALLSRIRAGLLPADLSGILSPLSPPLVKRCHKWNPASVRVKIAGPKKCQRGRRRDEGKQQKNPSWLI